MKKDTLSNLFLILILLAGLSLLLYPTFSNYWNELHSSKAIASYSAVVDHLTDDAYSRYWDDANAFNESLQNRENAYLLSDQQKIAYDEALNVAGNGIMGYIEIPELSMYLPIYHGTSDSVLAIAIGHLEWTSLPTGGESTHCVVSGHRGLPSAKLFSDLDQLVIGDVFMLNVLDEVLTYEVDQILIVEPDETDALLIEEGKDLCTLVTCTPYGVNSHRLLVRGHRIANQEQESEVIVRVTADAVIVEKLVVAPFLLIPILLIMLIILLIPKRKSKRRNEN